jgi:PhnB protein
MSITPYLFFDGRCEEAIAFYRQAVGAEVGMMLRFKDCPEPQTSGDSNRQNAEKIMHASLQIKGGVVMMSDGHARGRPKFEGFALSLAAGDEPEAERLFQALSVGGEVRMPLSRTFFAKRFGMLSDRFGVSWMIILE